MQALGRFAMYHLRQVLLPVCASDRAAIESEQHDTNVLMLLH